MLRKQCEPSKNKMPPKNAALYRLTFPKVHCVWTQLKLSPMPFTIQYCSIFLWRQHRPQKAFPSLWINLVVKSYGARQFFNNLLKRCWSLSQMARFITFHPLEPTAGWFECWPLSSLPTHQSCIYLSFSFHSSSPWYQFAEGRVHSSRLEQCSVMLLFSAHFSDPSLYCSWYLD